ncbi:MAG: glycosyltransferase [Candidatus Helarchaeales archaeon]
MRIGIFAEYNRNYTGGRWHIWSLAKTLSLMGHEIFYITKHAPLYYNNDDNIYIIREYNGRTLDYVVGTPIHACKSALSYSRRNKSCKLITLIFETPNFLLTCKHSHVRALATKHDWSGMLKSIRSSNKLLVNTFTTGKYALKWAGVNKDLYRFLPLLNREACKKAGKVGELNQIVAITRNAAHKHFDHIKRCLKGIKNPPKINHLNGSPSITDVDKFKMIKRSMFLPFPSEFEGLGIPPAEALLCTKPVIAYELPTLREVYGNHLDFVPLLNFNEFKKKFDFMLKNVKYRKKRGDKGRKFINKMFVLKNGVKILEEVFE